MPTPPPQAVYGDSEWSGLDTFNTDVNAMPGYVVQCDNLSVEAGNLVGRPGKQGQTSAALGQALQRPWAIKQTDGTTRIWYASGSNIYQHVPSTNTRTQVTYGGMPALTALSVTICQAGGYVYVADNSTTGLLRFAADGSGGEAVTGLTKPSAVTTALSHLSLIDSPGTATWTSYDTSAANLLDRIAAAGAGYGTPDITNTNTSGIGAGIFWKASGAGITFTTFADTGNPCATIGGAGNIETAAVVAFTAGSDLASDNAATPKTFEITFSARTNPGGDDSTSRVKVTLAFFNGMGGAIGVKSAFVGLMTFTTTTKTVTFDCRDISAPIASVKLKIEEANSGIAGDDPQVADITLKAGGYGFYVPTVSGTSLIVSSGTVYAAPRGDQCTDGDQRLVVLLPQTTAFYTAGKRFYTLKTADLTTTQRINAKVKLLFNSGDGVKVPVRMFVENTTSGVGAEATRAYSPAVELSFGAETNINFDVTTIDPAIRSAVTRIGFQFTDDVPIPDPSAYYAPNAAGGVPLLSIDIITKPGNLTPGYSYTYRYVEINAATDPLKLLNVIQSDGSDLSTAIVPTEVDSLAVVTFPARANATAGWFALYRFGDDLEGTGFLIGMFAYSVVNPSTGVPSGTVNTNIALGADVAKGQLPYYAAPANPYLVVTFTPPGTVGGAGIVIQDNTPSLVALNLAQYIGGREAPPTKIREIVSYQNRIWLLAGEPGESYLYASWLLSADVNAGLYFSRVVSPDDPNLPIKGFYTHAGTKDGDPALRLIPLESHMIILFAVKSPIEIIGTQPIFSLHQYTGSDSALGLSARNAVTVFNGAVWYLTANGVKSWTTISEPRAASLPIQGLLNPTLKNRGAALTASAYALCSMWQQGTCLYLAAPGTSSDGANTVIYRYDPHEGDGTGVSPTDGVAGVWTLWKQGNVSGGLALVGADNSTGHFVTGLDGMLYSYVQGEGDKATTAASITGIAFALTTRKWGGSQRDAERFTYKNAQYFALQVQPNAAEASGVVLTLGLTGADGGTVMSQTYTLADNSSMQNIRLKPPAIRGEQFQATVTGTFKKRFLLGPLSVQVSIGTGRRG